MNTLPRRTVVIVGGGLAAGLVARPLAPAGVDVLVLERGGDLREGAAARIPSQRDELRWGVRLGLIQDAAAETCTLRHSRSEPSRPMRRLQAFLPGTGVGGGGNHWGGESHRWSGYNTALRSRFVARYGRAAIPADMPLQDWDVSYDELERYYDWFEKLFGVSGKAGNLRGRVQPGGNPFEDPRQDEFPQPPLEITEAGDIFRQTAEREFGHRTYPMPAANSSGVYVNPDGMRLGPCQYCGHCARYLCEANAKGTPAALLFPWLEKQPKFELRPQAHVLAVDYDAAAKRARGVRYLDLVTGEECYQPAEVVVIAAFTLSTTRLLLGSGIGRAYDAATGQGVVGKNLCFQTASGVIAFFRDRWINPFLSAGATGTLFDGFNDDHFDHTGLGFLGGGSLGVGLGSGTPIGTRSLPPGTPRWGTAWKQANADWYNHAFTVGVQGSCYPHRENFLDLDPDYTDAYGQPLVRINFDWRENERRLSAYCTGQAEKIVRAMGATIVGAANPRTAPFDARSYLGTHVTGGTVMGPEPATSVVSPRLQHWDAENVFVAGASVFAHNAGFNPSQLVAALSLRLGEDLVRYTQKPGRL